MTHQLRTKKLYRHFVFRKIYGIPLCLGLFALMAFKPSLPVNSDNSESNLALESYQAIQLSEIVLSRSSFGADSYTITETGEMSISIKGGSGGGGSNTFGGQGAQVDAVFSVSAGDIIRFVVGQGSQAGATSAGGGGSTGVFINNDLVMVAGGGGGGDNSADAVGLGGTNNTGGSSGTGTNPGINGTNGNGGAAGTGNSNGGEGAGGGGILSAGANAVAGSATGGGSADMNPADGLSMAAGGFGSNQGSAGGAGFTGGGGCGAYYSGAGGGYSGGGSAGAIGGAGGGGSYLNMSLASFIAGNITAGANGAASGGAGQNGSDGFIILDFTSTVINQPPIASFTKDPSTGEAPLLVNFDASASSDPDGNSLSYAWDFGDGNSASGVSPTHTFVNPGSYTVELSVSDGVRSGAGLSATYFDELNFANQVLQRVDPGIDFNWGLNSPDPSVDAETFSVRWEGFVEAPSTGTYTFYTESDDGIRLWVDDQLIIDNWTDHGPTEDIGTITLTSGLAVPIRMEYYENGGGAVARLQWSGPSVLKQIISKDYLFPTAQSLLGEVTTTSQLIVVDAPDTEAPSTPQNVGVSNITQTLVDLNWDASTDNVSVAGYYVYQNGNPTPVATVSGTSATISGLTAVTTYQFAIAAFDAAGNVSGQSQAIQVSTTNFNEVPSANFAATPTTGTAPLAVSFDASASSDPDGSIVNYTWDFGDGNTGTGVTVNHTYVALGNFTAQLIVTDDSTATDTFTVTISVNEAPDTESPTTPQNLIASGITESSVDLSWTASTDNVGVQGYIVYEDGNPVDSTTIASISIVGLSPGISYQFSVVAFDAAGNQSASSQTVQVTTSTGSSCATPTNIALNREASQSSTYGNGTAALAVDGNTTGSSPWSADLQHTLNESQPWWQVDLGQQSHIQSLNIFNRSDNYQNRLANFYILTSESPFDPTASLEDHLANGLVSQVFYSGQAGAEESVSVDALGRYVRIQLSGSTPLHIAEIEVIGCPSETDPCFGAEPIMITPLRAISENAGIQQLVASPSGGSWSGDVNVDGSFDPSQGPGTYMAFYAHTNANGCSQVDSLELIVNPAGNCSNVSNLALNQATSQSSTYGNGSASLGVDGDTTGTSPWSADLQHTAREVQPWWEVDLGQISNLETLVLYNRTDGNQNRLREFYVLISDSPMDPSANLADHLANGAITHIYFSAAAGLKESIDLLTEGRYLRIQLTRTDILHMAEVEVYGCPSASDPCVGAQPVEITFAGPFIEDAGIQQLTANPSGGTWSGAVGATGLFDPSQGPGTYTVSYSYTNGSGCTQSKDTIVVVSPASGCVNPTNVALGKTANQISTYGNGVASIAVDGNTEGNSPWSADLQHTRNEVQPWWEVDLGASHDIETLYLYNRTQSNQNRLKDFYVLLSDSPFDPNASLNDHLTNAAINSYFYDGPIGAEGSFDIFGTGQYVRIQLSGNGILHMAEVEVYGCSDTVDPCLGMEPPEISLAGPFQEDAGLQQLLATPTGGSWSGSVNSNGTFDPSQGAGTYTVYYSYFDGQGCGGSDTLQIEVLPVLDPCEGIGAPLISAAGPFMEDAGLQQLLATPTGGSWSGSVNSNGTFDPSQGAGTYTVYYSYFDGQGCGGSDTLQIEVLPVLDPCEGIGAPVISAAGPFQAEAGIQQLQATPIGGSWSGAANTDGTFDPSQGAGFYTVYYSYFDNQGCGGSDTLQIEVLSVDTTCSTPTNLALNKVTEQSSTYGNGVSSIAVDGNTTGSSPWTADLQHTNSEFQPWWQVDLGSSSDIQEVIIHNRTDCCQGRLNNFYVLWSNEPFNASATLDQLLADPNVSKVNFTGAAGLEESIAVNAEGRYVRIQHTRDVQLHLAEVEVIGCISPNDPCFGAQEAAIDPIPTLAPNSGVYQLSAIPAGGVWSGDAAADGTFTADACPGNYEVIYTYLNSSQCETTDTATVLVQADTMDVFIYAGQSNATGAQNTLNVLRVGNSPFDSQISYSWNIPGTATSTGWDTLQAVQIDGTRRGHGAEISFGRTLFEAGYNNLGIIKVAKGGTNLANHWDPNSSLSGAQGNNGMYPEMVNYVNARLAELDAAGMPYRIKGFLWHQGEGDMNPTMANIYEANLAEFIGALRTDIDSDLSVYVASVYNPNATVEEGEAVRRAQRDVAAADPLTYVVNLDTVYFDTNFNPNSENLIADNLHYNSTGQIKIGSSFARTFLVFNPLVTCEDTSIGGCSSPQNLALNQPAEQSSTYGNGVAGLAVDGNRTGTSPWSADLQHTTVEFQPWWQVDLGEISAIEEFVIYNRTDCCAGRLNNFYIMWSDQPFSTTDSLNQLLTNPNVSHMNFSGAAGLLENIAIGATGRYVRLQHTRNIQLHIPEIEILGCPIIGQGSRFESVEESPIAQSLQPAVVVFPNPSVSRVDIQVSNERDDALIEYSLFNMTGQRIWQKLSGRVEKLNVENLAKGTYILKIQGPDWTRSRKLMVH